MALGSNAIQVGNASCCRQFLRNFSCTSVLDVSGMGRPAGATGRYTTIAISQVPMQSNMAIQRLAILLHPPPRRCTVRIFACACHLQGSALLASVCSNSIRTLFRRDAAVYSVFSGWELGLHYGSRYTAASTSTVLGAPSDSEHKQPLQDIPSPPTRLALGPLTTG